MKKILLGLQLCTAIAVFNNLQSQDITASAEDVELPDNIEESKEATINDIVVPDMQDTPASVQSEKEIWSAPGVQGAAKELDSAVAEVKNKPDVKEAEKNYKSKKSEFVNLKNADPKIKSLIEQFKQEKAKFENSGELKDAKEKLKQARKKISEKFGSMDLKQKREEIRKRFMGAGKDATDQMKFDQDPDVKKALEELKKVKEKLSGKLKQIKDQLKSAETDLSKKTKFSEAKENFQKKLGDKVSSAKEKFNKAIEKAKKAKEDAAS